MKLTPETVYGFTQALLLSRFDEPVATPEFHKELWEYMCLDDKYVAIAAPRGHAKSTAVTHAFTLASVLFRAKSYVVIVSDTEGQAVQFLGDIKREFYENDDLIELFDVYKVVKDTETEVVVQFGDKKQFRIIAKGSEQKLRGLKWRNKRPDLFVCDDLENDEIVMNDDRRAKFRNWFFNALLPAGSDSASYRVVGTILHMDSLLERLMPQWNHPNTNKVGLKYVNNKKRTWTSVRYEAHNDDFSLILWPEKFPKERLLQIRELYVEQGFPEGYSQEYLNYPIDDTLAYYRKADFRPIKDYDEYMEYYAGADLAISEKDQRAYSVIVVAGLTRLGVLKIVDVRRGRWDGREIIDELFSVQSRYDIVRFAIEKENIARALGSIIYEEMGTSPMKPFINFHEITPTQDKLQRGRSMQARFRAGKVEVDAEAEWYVDYFTELTQFPRGTYKDQVDATSLIGLMLDKMYEPASAQELADQEWEEEFADDLMDYSGMDAITGY